MSAEPFIETFRKLPSVEKIRLLQQMWDEVMEEVALQPLTDTQRTLLDERIDEHEAHPGDVEPWGQAREDILRGL